MHNCRKLMIRRNYGGEYQERLSKAKQQESQGPGEIRSVIAMKGDAFSIFAIMENCLLIVRKFLFVMSRHVTLSVQKKFGSRCMMIIYRQYVMFAMFALPCCGQFLLSLRVLQCHHTMFLAHSST